LLTHVTVLHNRHPLSEMVCGGVFSERNSCMRSDHYNKTCSWNCTRI